jgi:hypothetical protein
MIKVKFLRLYPFFSDASLIFYKHPHLDILLATRPHGLIKKSDSAVVKEDIVYQHKNIRLKQAFQTV